MVFFIVYSKFNKTFCKQTVDTLIRRRVLRYAQADLRLCWSHIPHCWKSHAAAHFMCAYAVFTVKVLVLKSVKGALAWYGKLT